MATDSPPETRQVPPIEAVSVPIIYGDVVSHIQLGASTSKLTVSLEGQPNQPPQPQGTFVVPTAALVAAARYVVHEAESKNFQEFMDLRARQLAGLLRGDIEIATTGQPPAQPQK